MNTRFHKDQLVAVLVRGRVSALLKISHVTPTGRVVLSSGAKYSNEGIEIGGDKWDFTSITEVTPQIREEFLYRRNLSILRNQDWEKVSHELINQIAALLKEQKSDM